MSKELIDLLRNPGDMPAAQVMERAALAIADLIADRDSWAQQASDRAGDAVKALAERDRHQSRASKLVAELAEARCDRDELAKAREERDALAETVHAIALLVTTDHESKESFIRCVCAVLGEDPALRVSEVRRERDGLAAGQKQMGEDLIEIQRIHGGQKASLYNELAALKAELTALREREPAAFVLQHDETGRTLIRLSEEADQFALFNPRWAKCSPLYALPVPALNVAAPLMASAFRTTEHECGIAKMVFKFKSLSDLHAADDEWRAIEAALLGAEEC